MKIGGGGFGGGGFPGGGNPPGGDGFGSGPPDFDKRLIGNLPDGTAREMHVVPGGDGTVQKHVFPGSSGTGGGGPLPASVFPSDIPSPGSPLISAGHLAGLHQPVIHMVVFARYQMPGGEQLIKDIGYLDAASGDDFHLVLAGYTRDIPAITGTTLSEPKAIPLRKDVTWYYDDAEFDRQVRMVEDATTWKYRGGVQLIIFDVPTIDRYAENMQAMFGDVNIASLANAIVVDVDEIKEHKLFADFDRFFAAIRSIIREIRLEYPDRLTWWLSNRLALTQDGVALKALAKAFKPDFYEALDAVISLKSFAIRDIRKNK